MSIIKKKIVLTICNVFELIEYPYFINPPTLLSATYDRIEIELNFQENNIKYLDKIMNLKYYQLFYKVSTTKTINN